jgi:hypothetical protein
VDQVQNAHEVASQLPEELAIQLGAIAFQEDEDLVGILETHSGEFGARGFFINTGMVSIPPRCAAGSMKLEGFGRMVALACRTTFYHEHGDDIESALARWQKDREELSTAPDRPLH